MSLNGQERQRRYYERTAASYDDRHSQEESAHFRALTYVSALVSELGARSILDIGSGTGRAIRSLRSSHPRLEFRGVEPVSALIQQAESSGVPAGTIVMGRGECLPFDDEAFDIVCSFGVMHHVPNPLQVQREMARCAAKAVVVSDSNRFGQGGLVSRLTKFGLYVTGTWPLFDFMRTRGKGYMVSEGDGVFYSYSVYDTLPLLQEWAARVFLVPTELNPRTPRPLRRWLGPLLSAPSLLVCAVRDD